MGIAGASSPLDGTPHSVEPLPVEPPAGALDELVVPEPAAGNDEMPAPPASGVFPSTGSAPDLYSEMLAASLAPKGARTGGPGSTTASKREAIEPSISERAASWLQSLPGIGSSIHDAKELMKDPVPRRYRPILQDSTYDVATTLAKMGQVDSLTMTTQDEMRCTCNSTVAMLLAGGENHLLGAVLSLRDMKGLSAEDRFTLEVIAKAIRNDELTVGHLQVFADMLKRYFGGSDPTKGLSNEQITEMHRALGIASSSAGPCDAGGNWERIPKTPLENTALNREIIATELMGKVPAGKQVMIGTHFSLDAHGKNNHAMTIGRREDGTVYLYDPGTEPHYVEGEAAVKARLARHIPTGDDGRLQTDFTGPVVLTNDVLGMVDRWNRDFFGPFWK